MSQIPTTPPTSPPVETTTPATPVVAPVVPTTPVAPATRAANGRFIQLAPATPTPVVAPVVPIPPVVAPVPTPPSTTPATPTPTLTGKDVYLAKYADKLKVELGDKYSPNYDKMSLESRIDAMSAAIDGLKPKTPILEKTEGKIPLGIPAISQKPKTMGEIQEAIGYADLIKNAGSNISKAQSIYAKLAKKQGKK